MKSNKRLLSLATLAALAALTGCGGSGGGDGPPLDLTKLQGYWTGSVSNSGAALGGATKARAVVLEDGTAWVFLHDGSQVSEPLLGLATASVHAVQDSFSGSGKRYPASGASVADLTATGSAPTGNSFTVNVTSGGASSALALTYDNAYETDAVQSDVVGTWHFTKAGGTIVADWSVDGAGVLSGTSTLGCTYSGTLRPRNTTTAVFAASVTESCTGSTKVLSGICRLNSTKAFLTFGLTTAGGAEAEAFVAEKQLPL
jgi:hypothetical protein